MMKGICTGLFFSFLSVLVFGESPVALSGTLEWDRMELNAAVILNLAPAGIRLPAGRSRAEELIDTEYPALIRSHILSILTDSSSTLEDLMERGEFSLRNAGSIALSAGRVPPTVSADLATLSASYTIDLTNISALLIRHSHAMDIRRPLIPVPAATYTGIIIIAYEELPVHGRNSSALPVPCLFPKVWDTDMNLIYERNMLNPDNTAQKTMVRYVSPEDIFRSNPSGLSPELGALVGANPLRILARGVFGIHPTDPIIDRDDALVILSSESNRQLLREGRVAIALNPGTLKRPLNPPDE
ncbi:MAG: polymerase [Spirochaetaceae bacterium]|nr:polymerase [Spirochaetaceae bacterium]